MYSKKVKYDATSYSLRMVSCNLWIVYKNTFKGKQLYIYKYVFSNLKNDLFKFFELIN